MSQLVFGWGMNAPLGPTLTSKIMTVCRPSCSRHANGTSAISGTRMTLMRDAELVFAVVECPSIYLLRSAASE